MSNKVPELIAKKIKDRVFRKAEQFNYLARSRTENRTFIDQLVKMEDVGVRLSDYMSKSEIRTYIKDGILNRYSKDKNKQEQPIDLGAIIKSKLNIDVIFIEKDKKVSLFKSVGGDCYVVTSDGTYLKWETALRNALLYVASKPFSANKDIKVYIILVLFARHQKISPSNLKLLQKALDVCNAMAHAYGEK